MSDDDDEPIELTVNPTLRLALSVTLRRRDQPVQTFRLAEPRDPLFQFLLDLYARPEHDGKDEVELEVPDDEVLDEAIARGVLIPSGEVPAEVAYRCDLDDEEEDTPLAGAPSPMTLSLNPGLFLQRETELPEALRDRIFLQDPKALRPSQRRYGLGALSRSRPVLWVEDPRTHLLMPLWPQGETGTAALQLVDGEVDPAQLAPRVREQLWRARVLLGPEDRRGYDEEETRSFRARLAADRYVVLRDLLDPLALRALRSYFRALRREGLFELDTDQVVGMRDGLYCDLVGRHLQHQLVGLINRVVPDPIKPSYSWVVRYRPSAVLRRHRDRQQCRWNLSLCLDDDPPADRAHAWPLYFDAGGRAQAVLLAGGDAVLYSGTEVPHWRNALPEGRYVTMGLFHYVDRDFAEDLF